MSRHLLFTKQRGMCALVLGYLEASQVGKYKSFHSCAGKDEGPGQGLNGRWV